MIPSAKIEKRESAEPENRFSRPRIELVKSTLRRSSGTRQALASQENIYSSGACSASEEDSSSSVASDWSDSGFSAASSSVSGGSGSACGISLAGGGPPLPPSPSTGPLSRTGAFGARRRFGF